jgi:hypothetical protein
METNMILAAIDEEILKLQQARALLVTSEKSEPVIRRPGRPKGSINKMAESTVTKTLKRTMSSEGKARIAAAQKKRWAEVKRASKRAKSIAAAFKQTQKLVPPAKTKTSSGTDKASATKARTLENVQPSDVTAA